jgi:flagellin-specific chaperone FliS
MQNDPQKVRELLPMIAGMRETWVEAIRRYRSEAAESAQVSALVG